MSKRRGEFYLQPNRKCEFATPEEEQQARQAALEEYLLVLKAVLPYILEKFARIPDPRQPLKTKHKITVVLFFGVIAFAFGYESRRQANREGTRPTVLEVLRSVFPEIDSCPHMDTVAGVLETISVEELESIHVATVKQLIHNKKFLRLMVDGAYVVAIDGTQKWSGDWRFDPKLLTRTHHDGKTTYRVYVLEAALVGPKGIAIPLMSEFCENDPEAGEQKKQDCELKAFYRLSARLKSFFPKQRLMIVADGLYPKGPVMDICLTNHWDFMIVLPDEVCLSGVWHKAKAIRDGQTRDSQPGQTLVNQWGDRLQNFWWANYIVYTWKDHDGIAHHTVIHLVVCHETWHEGEITKQNRWAWISAKPINSKNVLERCNDAARSRWNIEEYILTEKTRGYEYEHMFSFNWNGMKAWHALMHLGHLINILVIHAVGLWNTCKKLGIKGFLRFLRDSAAGRWADISRLAQLPEKPQLRLVI